jgi:hypothetical protein
MYFVDKILDNCDDSNIVIFWLKQLKRLENKVSMLHAILYILSMIAITIYFGEAYNTDLIYDMVSDYINDSSNS